MFDYNFTKLPINIPIYDCPLVIARYSAAISRKYPFHSFTFFVLI